MNELRQCKDKFQDWVLKVLKWFFQTHNLFPFEFLPVWFYSSFTQICFVLLFVRTNISQHNAPSHCSVCSTHHESFSSVCLWDQLFSSIRFMKTWSFFVFIFVLLINWFLLWIVSESYLPHFIEITYGRNAFDNADLILVEKWFDGSFTDKGIIGEQ